MKATLLFLSIWFYFAACDGGGPSSTVGDNGCPIGYSGLCCTILPPTIALGTPTNSDGVTSYGCYSFAISNEGLYSVTGTVANGQPPYSFFGSTDGEQTGEFLFGQNGYGVFYARNRTYWICPQNRPSGPFTLTINRLSPVPLAIDGAVISNTITGQPFLDYAFNITQKRTLKFEFTTTGPNTNINLFKLPSFDYSIQDIKYNPFFVSGPGQYLVRVSGNSPYTLQLKTFTPVQVIGTGGTISFPNTTSSIVLLKPSAITAYVFDTIINTEIFYNTISVDTAASGGNINSYVAPANSDIYAVFSTFSEPRDMSITISSPTITTATFDQDITVTLTAGQYAFYKLTIPSKQIIYTQLTAQNLFTFYFNLQKLPFTRNQVYTQPISAFMELEAGDYYVTIGAQNSANEIVMRFITLANKPVPQLTLGTETDSGQIGGSQSFMVTSPSQFIKVQAIDASQDDVRSIEASNGALYRLYTDVEPYPLDQFRKAVYLPPSPTPYYIYFETDSSTTNFKAVATAFTPTAITIGQTLTGTGESWQIFSLNVPSAQYIQIICPQSQTINVREGTLPGYLTKSLVPDPPYNFTSLYQGMSSTVLSFLAKATQYYITADVGNMKMYNFTVRSLPIQPLGFNVTTVNPIVDTSMEGPWRYLIVPANRATNVTITFSAAIQVRNALTTVPEDIYNFQADSGLLVGPLNTTKVVYGAQLTQPIILAIDGFSQAITATMTSTPAASELFAPNKGLCQDRITPNRTTSSGSTSASGTASNTGSVSNTGSISEGDSGASSLVSFLFVIMLCLFA
eukprot:TRINITY_DN1288_c0_g1_i5.p1 TRINITY_DN1288_c0_g1~~TRINITY_DN1288_c0_g1_i5.p1  ORF type:complete len:797 (-),score=171.73 TRINITY_DN1288_c0_g1_i5:64-2454(-)